MHPSAWHAHIVHVAQLRYMLRHGMPQVIEEVLRRRTTLAEVHSASECLDVEKPTEMHSVGGCLDVEKPTETHSVGSVATTEPYSVSSSSCASPNIRANSDR